MSQTPLDIFPDAGLASSSSGSLRPAAFSLSTGSAMQGADVVAGFRIGDNSASPGGLHEFVIGSGNPLRSPASAVGHMTWDPAYRSGRGLGLSAVANARFQILPTVARWAVGTHDFIQCDCPRYRRIERLQISALTRVGFPHRRVVWEKLELTFHYASGARTVQNSPCLPYVSTERAVRGAKSAKVPLVPTFLEQHADARILVDDVIGIDVLGQIALHVHPGREDEPPLSEDDLQGWIRIFTDCAGARQSA